MSLYFLPGFLFFAILVLKFLVLAPIESKLSSDLAFSTFRWRIACNIARNLQFFAAVALFSSLLLILALFAFGLGGSGTADAVGGVIARLQDMRSRLQDVEPVIGLAAMALALAGALYVTYRSSRMQLSAAAERARQLEFDALVAQLNEGKLPVIEPNARMNAIADRFGEVAAKLQRLMADDAADPEPGGQAWRRDEIAAVERERDELRRLYILHDLDRRVTGKFAGADVDIPRPEGWRQKLLAFFFSRGLFGSMRRTSKLLFAACVALLVPSLAAVASPLVADAVDGQIDGFEAVYLALSEQEARASWDAYRRPAVETEAADPLAEDDLQAIGRLARALETGVALKMSQALRLESAIPVRTLIAQGMKARLFGTYQKTVAAQGLGVSVKAFAADAELTELHRAIVDFELDAAIKSERPATSIGRHFEQRMRERAASMPAERWQQLKNRINAEWGEFQVLASRQYMRSAFVTNLLFDGVAEGIPATPELKQFSSNLEDIVTRAERARILDATEGAFLQTFEQDGVLPAVRRASDPVRPHLIGRVALDSLYVEAASFAGTDGFDRDLLRHAPYIDEITEARVDRALARSLAGRMAVSSVPEGFQLIDPLASLVEFSSYGHGGGKGFRPPRSVNTFERFSRRPARPSFRFRWRR